VAYPDAFALKNSGLNGFLFADVGAELNGSGLTILSVLARLEQDPWAEAARWAKLPKANAIDCLAESIARMPLSPQALADARTTASRLILLLPSQTGRLGQSEHAATGTASMRVASWLPIALLCCAIAFGILVDMLMTPKSTAMFAISVEQTFDHKP
jgi:hypothetical protein